MRMRLGSLYLMLTVDPSERTRSTGYNRSYFWRPQHTTDVLLELNWEIWPWSTEASRNPPLCALISNWNRELVGEKQLPLHGHTHNNNQFHREIDRTRTGIKLKRCQTIPKEIYIDNLLNFCFIITKKTHKDHIWLGLLQCQKTSNWNLDL